MTDTRHAKGRSARRGIDHFFKVGAAIKNPEIGATRVPKSSIERNILSCGSAETPIWKADAAKAQTEITPLSDEEGKTA